MFDVDDMEGTAWFGTIARRKDGIEKAFLLDVPHAILDGVANLEIRSCNDVDGWDVERIVIERSLCDLDHLMCEVAVAP